MDNLPDLRVQSWSVFRDATPATVKFLVEDIIPDPTWINIAAPPKAGKTWLALGLSIALASGRPFAGHLVPNARPVLYVALEGLREALRDRVAALARGAGLDPDGTDLDRLHFSYRPPGIDLSDPQWAQALITESEAVGAALVVVDVLRAATSMRENEAADFNHLRRLLMPLIEQGRSLALLHHFIKVSEIGRARVPREKMSGTGALGGAADVGIYIVSPANAERSMRVSFEMRDIASPAPLNLLLDGKGSGPNGSLTYEDSAELRVDNNAASSISNGDYVAQIWEHLGEHPASTADEIRQVIGKHRDATKRLLESNPTRFVRVPPPPGRKSNAQCWSRSEVPVQDPQTGTDEQTSGQLPAGPPARLSPLGDGQSGTGGSPRLHNGREETRIEDTDVASAALAEGVT